MGTFPYSVANFYTIFCFSEEFPPPFPTPITNAHSIILRFACLAAIFSNHKALLSTRTLNLDHKTVENAHVMCLKLISHWATEATINIRNSGTVKYNIIFLLILNTIWPIWCENNPWWGFLIHFAACRCKIHIWWVFVYSLNLFNLSLLQNLLPAMLVDSEL